MFSRAGSNAMTQAQKVDYLLSKGNAIKEQYQKQKFEKQFQERLIYSKKIENYIPKDWDHNRRKLYDLKLQLNYSIAAYGNNDAVIKQTIKVNSFRLQDLNNDLKHAFYCLRDMDDKATIFIFFGESEEEVFEKIVINKAKFYPKVPQVVDGRIVGQVSLATIMQLFHSYDPYYALYLKKLYDAGKINTSHII